MSRMDRYYKKDSTSTKRTTRNQELYKTIYQDSEYSNIEGIATIDKSNEIDITKIKNMLENRDIISKPKEFRNYDEKKLEVPLYETFERDENRVYDIRDILKEAKVNKSEEKYHNLSDVNLDMLKKLKEENNKKNKDNLENMIDTITNTSKLNKLSDQDLGLDMFSSLKSSGNTIVKEKSSIKSILEEAKKLEEDNKKNNQSNTSTDLDKSFFTSSMSFKNEDFEQIEELNKNVKKNNFILKLLLFILILAITIGIIVLIFNVLK